MEKEFILITFGSIGKETEILPEFISSCGKSASCGMMSVTTFKSTSEKEEIAEALTSGDVKFVLFERGDSVSNYPDEVKVFMDTMHPEEFITSKNNKQTAKKLSVEDQLKNAVENQDFELAAILRDRLNIKLNLCNF